MWAMFEGETGWPSAHDRTTASHIICLNAEMPSELQGLIWQTLGSPLGAPYLPLYHALQEIPHELSEAPQGGNPAYWAFRRLLLLAGSKTSGDLPTLQAMWHAHEQELVLQQHQLRRMLPFMYGQSLQNALTFAQCYSTGCILQMVEKAHRLMTKLSEKTGNA